MATDKVADKKKQSELSDSSPSVWNVTTTKMVIQFYKENRLLWDKNHKDYGKKTLQKKMLIPLVAKLERSMAREHRTGVVSQRLVLQTVHTERLVAEANRSDLSPSVSRP